MAFGRWSFDADKCGFIEYTGVLVYLIPSTNYNYFVVKEKNVNILVD